MALVAVIPARGGSKGIPKKNLAKIGELSLVELALKFAVSIDQVSQVILSSDSSEILQVATSFEGVFLDQRSSHLATDASTTDDLLLNLIGKFGLLENDIILLLEPTSPFRTVSTFEKAYTEFINNKYDTLITVSRDSGAFWVLSEEEKFVPATNNTSSRRQERSPLFRELGVFYFINVGAFKQRGKITGSKNILAYEIFGVEQIDINTPLDLQIAQSLYSYIEL
jgi:CMP-N,N'-diacetyllegionaminic acid synthase